MRTIALTANVALLAFICYLLVTKGLPNDNEVLLVLSLILAPTLSIIALYPDKKDDLISLFLRRKALEEKIKIKKLQDN